MAAVELSVSSGSSDTSSTGEDERMKRLFQTCDGDGDGYINRSDLLVVCRHLNMEGSVAEIMGQLGADERGKISFEDFNRCRMQLVHEEAQLSQCSKDSETRKLREHIHSWPTSSETSLGTLSGARESWEDDSGSRDLQSPEIQHCQTEAQQNPALLQKLLLQPGTVLEHQTALQKLLLQPGTVLEHQTALQKLLLQPGTVLEHQTAIQKLLEKSSVRSAPLAGSYLELANTLHLATLASLKGDVVELNKRLVLTERERELLEKRLAKAQGFRRGFHRSSGSPVPCSHPWINKECYLA